MVRRRKAGQQARRRGATEHRMAKLAGHIAQRLRKRVEKKNVFPLDFVGFSVYILERPNFIP
jgi:hypothetical protein